MNSILKSKSTTPTLRFKEFNKEWSKKRLSTLLKVSRKRNTDNKYSKDDVLSVSGQFGVVNQVELLGRSYAGKVVNNYHVVETNDVVYTKSPLKSNPYGIIKINQGKSGIVSTLYAIYKIKDGHCPKFIGKYFESDDRTNSYLRPLVHKGAKNDMKITNERVLIDSIFVPALLEQQKIADFLGSVDAWLDNLRQQKAALEEYKKGCMQKLFTQQVRFKDDNGKEFPRWQTVQMSDIGDAFNGLSGKTGEAFGEGEPYITYKQIFAKSVINPDGFDFVKVTPSERQNRAQHGDILFTTSSEIPQEVGYASVLIGDIRPFLNSFSFGFRPKSLADLRPEYSRYHFRSGSFRRKVVKLAQGSTRYNMSKVQFMRLQTSIPSPAEQQKIANFLTVIDQTLTAKEEEIVKVEQWKKGLMQKMFI